MKPGKRICETLKGIRRDIAQANDIDYNPTPCSHQGDCAGTCPACESELRWLERQLRLRQSLGKAVTIAGLSMAVGVGATSCNIFQPNGNVKKVEPAPGSKNAPEVLDGEVGYISDNDSTSICLVDSAKETKANRLANDTTQRRAQPDTRRTAGMVRMLPPEKPQNPNQKKQTKKPAK